MNRSAIVTMPHYFDRYINQVADVPITGALQRYGRAYFEQELTRLLQLGDNVYAPGKWTVKDTIQHLTDAERVFAYRALRFGRGDTTPLPGFDEELYAQNTTAAGSSLATLLEDFYAVRESTLMLFKSFTDAMLLREGISNGNTISVLALGFTIVGHGIHHMTILKERYYPLLNEL